MTIEIEILGCGSSSGVPAIGNNWGSCNPNNPKNRRLRTNTISGVIKLDLIQDQLLRQLKACSPTCDRIFSFFSDC